MGMLQRFFFNLWYYRNPPWETGVSPPELLEHIASHPPGRALDLGCGTGTNVITLARHGWQATGVDFAWRAIRTARRKAQRENVNVDFHLGDVTHLKEISGTFDLILDMGCFHSLLAGEQQAYLHNLDRYLAPRGTFLLYGFLRDDDETGPGLQEADLSRISAHLEMIHRKNGTERRLRPSAWLTYRQSPEPVSTSGPRSAVGGL